MAPLSAPVTHYAASTGDVCLLRRKRTTSMPPWYCPDEYVLVERQTRRRSQLRRLLAPYASDCRRKRQLVRKERDQIYGEVEFGDGLFRCRIEILQRDAG